MHPFLEQQHSPPDFHRFVRTLRREPVDRIPLVELSIHPQVTAALLDLPSTDDPKEIVRRAVTLQARLGYDVVKVSAGIPFDLRRRQSNDAATAAIQWADEHNGPIQSAADFDNYPWPAPTSVDYSPFDVAAGAAPEGVGLVGFTGGVLEYAMDLMGMQHFLLGTRRTPELVAAVLQRVGEVLHSVFSTYAQMDAICALWIGDDLGHKHGTLLRPDFIRTQITPWYAKFAALAHAAGKPFILHSCGMTAEVMADLVATGIDAKHSFEDGIQPVEQFYDAWSDRLAVLGGVDLHLLSTGPIEAIAKRTRAILEHCGGRGYAAGSGNSIPDYVPPEHYLAMVAEVGRVNAGFKR